MNGSCDIMTDYQVWIAMESKRKEIWVSVILLSIFSLTPAPIRAHSRAYPHSLLLTPAPPRSLPHTPAHSCSLLHVLMHKYL